jgi:hypothetical protein
VYEYAGTDVRNHRNAQLGHFEDDEVVVSLSTYQALVEDMATRDDEVRA